MYHTLNSFNYSKRYERKTFLVVFKKRQFLAKNRLSNLMSNYFDLKEIFLS